MHTITFPLHKLLEEKLAVLLYASAFFIPALVSAPQFTTGTIINCLLFVASEKLPKKSVYPVVILPSLGAISHGVLFGPQTVFLYYFLPFIWIGNYILVSVFAAMKGQKYIVRVGISSLCKYLALYLFALIYVRLGIVPKAFLLFMGTIQLFTALLGGLLSYLPVYITRKHE